MLSTMLYFANAANEAIKGGLNVSAIAKMKSRAGVSRMKGIKDSEIESSAKKLRSEMDTEFAHLAKDFDGGSEAAPEPKGESENVQEMEVEKEPEKEKARTEHRPQKAEKHRKGAAKKKR
jgi:hypothetical protein